MMTEERIGPSPEASELDAKGGDPMIDWAPLEEALALEREQLSLQALGGRWEDVEPIVHEVVAEAARWPFPVTPSVVLAECLTLQAMDVARSKWLAHLRFVFIEAPLIRATLTGGV